MNNYCEFCGEETKFPLEVMMLHIYYIRHCNNTNVLIESCCKDNMIKGMELLRLYKWWIGNPRN